MGKDLLRPITIPFLALSLLVAPDASFAQQTAAPGPLGGRKIDLEALDIRLHDIELPSGPWSANDGFPRPATLPGVNPGVQLSTRLLQFRFDTQRTFDPDEASSKVKIGAIKLDGRCKLGNTIINQSNCDQANRLRGVAGSLAKAASANPGCGPAAREFDLYYQNSNPPDDVARKFDLACLDSFVRRKTANNLDEPQSAIPAVFAQGGTNPKIQGALGSIALLSADNVTFCGGLLRPDRRLVTARHCFTKMRGAFTEGRVTAQSADGKVAPLAVLPKPVAQSVMATTDAADDWIVLGLDGTGTLPVPDTTLVRADEVGEVTMAGFYPHFQATVYATEPKEDWTKGLRVPKPGLCQILDIPPGCVQVACQTVRGFSGAPVFQLQPATSGRPLTVIGFVSGSNADSANCPATVPGYTVLVSANQIKFQIN